MPPGITSRPLASITRAPAGACGKPRVFNHVHNAQSTRPHARSSTWSHLSSRFHLQIRLHRRDEAILHQHIRGKLPVCIDDFSTLQCAGVINSVR